MCGYEIEITNKVSSFGLEILTQFQLVPIHKTDVVAHVSSSFILVVESEKMNNKLWTLCEEQKVEIRQHKQETSRLNTELVQVRYISGLDRIHILLIVMELFNICNIDNWPI